MHHRDLWIRLVFKGKFDVQAVRFCSSGRIANLGAFICSFHQPWTAAGYDITSKTRQMKRKIAPKIVQRIPAGNPAASKDGDSIPPRLRWKQHLEIIDDVPELHQYPVNFRIALLPSFTLRHSVNITLRSAGIVPAQPAECRQTFMPAESRRWSFYILVIALEEPLANS